MRDDDNRNSLEREKNPKKKISPQIATITFTHKITARPRKLLQKEGKKIPG